MSHISPAVVAHIAQLANLEVSVQEQQSFATAFEETMDEVAKILDVDVTDVIPTAHTTGMTNVWREDVVDTDRVLSQQSVLGQAEKVFANCIVVDRVIEESA